MLHIESILMLLCSVMEVSSKYLLLVMKTVAKFWCFFNSEFSYFIHWHEILLISYSFACVCTHALALTYFLCLC